MEVLSPVAKTRPLALKRCNNKVLMSANVKATQTRYKIITHLAQNGFVPGRDFLNNVVDINPAGRIYSTEYQGCSETIKSLVSSFLVMAPLDFTAAFPSVFQNWVWLVMEHRRLPVLFLTLMKASYKDANAAFTYNNQTYIIIMFLSGVLQGCPASGWQFNSALDPFLFCFARTLNQGVIGIARACWDDLSFALRRLKHPILFYPICAAARRPAGLDVHPKKSTIVPLIKLDQRRHDQIKRWPARKDSEWANFQIADAAQLLGFYVGPGRGRFNWNGPLCKLVERVQEVQSANPPVHINAYDYSIRVCPVLATMLS